METSKKVLQEVFQARADEPRNHSRNGRIGKRDQRLLAVLKDLPLPPHVHRVVVRGREYFYFQHRRGTAKEGKRHRLMGIPGTRRFSESLIAVGAGGADYHLRYFTLLLDGAKSRARGKRVEFSLELDDVAKIIHRQLFRCAISGVQFEMPDGEGRKFLAPFAPSIDRLDNALGYTPQNVRVVCRIANFAMNCWGEEALLKLARGIAKR